MFADFTTPAELSFRSFSPRQMMRRLAAAIAAAEDRARQRRDYEHLLESDEIMRDAGLTRDEVRRALHEMEAGR